MRQRFRRRLLAVAAFAALAPCVIGAGAVVYRHRPFEIPPSLRLAARFDSGQRHALRLRFTGTTGYELTDGETTLLFDPVITRPTLTELFTGPIRVDASRVARTFPRADHVLVNHSHHDHAVDAATVALGTGAVLIGSRSSNNLAAAEGVPKAQRRVVVPGDVLRLGRFEVRVAGGEHIALLGLPSLLAGRIEDDVRPPLWVWDYLQDGTLAYHVSHPSGTVLFQPQRFLPDSGLPPASTVIFGVAGAPFEGGEIERLRARYQAKLMLPTHYDNFFQPRERGLAWLPDVSRPELIRALEALRDAHAALLDYDEWITLPSTSTKTSGR